MISASAAFVAANSSPHKEPVFLIRIAGYKRAFSNVDFGGTQVPGLPFAPQILQYGSRLNTFGGLELFGGTATMPETVTAGDPLFAFLSYGDGGPTPGIDNVAGSAVTPSWTLLYSTSTIAVWAAIANASGTLSVEFTTGSNRANSEFYVLEMAQQFADYTTDSNGDSFTIIFQEDSDSSQALEFTFATTASFNAEILAGTIIIKDAGGAALITESPGPIDVYPWLVSMDDLTTSVAMLEGGADFQGWNFNVQDFDGLITGDFPNLVFEGRELVLTHGFRSLDADDFMTLATLAVDTVASDNNNKEYTFSTIDALQQMLARSIFTKGDDGYAVDKDHPRTINGHPIDIFIAAAKEAGQSAARIKTTKLAQYRDGPYAGWQFTFTLTSAPACKDFLQSEICKPLGAYMRGDVFGNLDVNFMLPLSLDPVATLDSDTLTEIPLEEQAELVNQVCVKFDYGEEEDKPLAESVTSYGRSINRYGPGPLRTIEAHGMRSGFQGFYLSSFISSLIFSRYGLKNAMFEDSSSLVNIWSACRLESGDLVNLTCPFTPDRESGVIGFTDRLFEILDRTCHLSDMTLRVGFTLLRVDWPRFKQFEIAPDAEPDFPSSSAQDLYLFLANDSDQYSDATPANTLC